MSTSKTSKSGKSQKRLTAFFGGGGSKADRETKKTVASEEDDIPVQFSKTDGKIESSSLPPIHDIPAMFADLVSRVPQLKGVTEHIQGRKLRVATMCSGTESPLLALDMICQSVKDQHSIALEFEHVFSCEIEPFKQAYIERNFKPPLLFRDVCELGDYEATTAYGALAPVPGDVDLLVAGTSCVDYSNLNNERKSIDGGGESGRTFHGMMSWVSNHRPPLVILENVCSAPWDRVKDYFKRQGYSAEFLRVDTKLYYIPHTRTRVYLLAVDSRGSNIPMEWKNWISTKLKRPASSTLDAFLLPSDDPRIHQARQKLVQDSGGVSESRTGRIDWTRCESRHARARLEEALGPKRPLTNWEEGGGCRMPDFAWQDWGIRQVERVWDLMDISLLRSAKIGVDPSYKTLVWNLSQNVDRSTGSSKAGICPCLTPSMIPYITNRGGPMVGVEALAMQGLPVDKLLLTRESQDELADLAGNAMSSTVVGACIIAALVVGRKLLKTGDDKETYEMKKLDAVETAKDESIMDVDSSRASDLRIEDHLSGHDQLVEKPLDLSSTGTNAVESMLNHAQRSVRLCHCEGRKDITMRELLRCRDCGSSSCKKCAGRPEHNFEPLDVQTVARLPPPTFVRELKSILPMCLSIVGVTEKLLDELRDFAGVSIPEKRWASWRAAVLRATGSELRFVEPKRQEIWSAVYQSPTSTFELYLDPKQTEWRLYAKPLDSEPANAEIRRLLQLPVARLKCSGDFLLGRWQFAMPHSTELRITVTGNGQFVPSWEARLGLLDDKFKNKRVHSHLNISVPEHQKSLFDRDISGTYALLDKCGTACGALHKRVESADCESSPPLFMMLDPTRCGDVKDDSFLFTSSMRRYEYGESRPIICKLAPSWRQSDAEGDQSVACHIPVLWTDSNIVTLEPRLLSDATFAVPQGTLTVAVSTDDCAEATALLSCNVPIPDDAGPEWPRQEWREVDKLNERGTFRALAWLLERIRHRCAPALPTIKWKKDGKKVLAIEDSKEAGQYERDLKLRPSPFTRTVGRVRVGLNIASLLHRALSRLPTENRTERPTLSWRLDTDFRPSRTTVEHTQPPHFGPLPLRPEQLRSLTWMLEREAPDAPPFIEGGDFRGYSRAPWMAGGGSCSTAFGYGKTAITLGLIDCAYNDVKEELELKKDIYGRVPVKATLAIVPPHLTRQWASEAKRFAPKRFKKTVVVSTASQVNSLTIEDVQQADLVIVASNLFQSNVYLANLEALAAAGTLPSQDGRYFNARLDICLEGLKKQVELLKTRNPAGVMKAIRDARRREEELEAQTKSLDHFPAKRTPSGQKPQVVIKKLPPKMKHQTTDSEDEDADDSTTRPRRKSTCKTGEDGSDYEDADDADDHVDDEQVSDDDSDVAKKPKLSRSIAKPTPPPSSGSVTCSSEDERPKKKVTTKGKSVKRESNSSADDSMDVDDPPSSASASSHKKRKATDTSDKPTKKQKRREDTDPWHLESAAVRRNWAEMRSPPLEVFHFARVVVDEYTYLGGKVHSMVTKLTADRRWVLSGTPPTHDFGSVKTIAAHLNIHLGIDDDGEGHSAMIKKRIREQTKVEAFHSFREVHTQEWHAHRHRLGQVFLDMFVRQNIAEIDEIPCTYQIQKVILPAAERAIYLELEHHLRALDMTIKRAKKTESDREKRLNNALGESKTAEEALLKRCSHFDLDVKDKENAMKACEIIVQDRTKQLEECRAELLKELQKGAKQEKKIGKLTEESMFQEYARVSRLEGVGDQEATDMIRGLLDEAEVPVLSPNHFANKTKGKDDNISNSVKDLIWEHREHTHNIRKLTKELVGRVRSLRYFTVVRDLQRQRDTPPKVPCPGCKRDEVPMGEVAVLSSCGHMGCMTCVRRSADREECVYAVTGMCKAAARILNIARDGRGRHYGRKLEMVIDLIKNKIPKAERVLIFVQFPDLMMKVANALKVHKIKFLEIQGSATQKSKNLEKYQNDSEERVLLLNLMDESASGANLTSANHAIFLSPLLAPTQEIYDACETQAVGRLRRYGQLKHIHEQRTKEKVC
ncbi:hypothetical protein F5141DRAFT_1195546 [Pisolithus sp. B1]|nr:hypothetical protein F5141DRAFT_1195546 [Pisolithus sp. B1]